MADFAFGSHLGHDRWLDGTCCSSELVRACDLPAKYHPQRVFHSEGKVSEFTKGAWMMDIRDDIVYIPYFSSAGSQSQSGIDAFKLVLGVFYLRLDLALAHVSLHASKIFDQSSKSAPITRSCSMRSCRTCSTSGADPNL